MKQSNIYDFVPKPTRKTKFTNLIKLKSHYLTTKIGPSKHEDDCDNCSENK